MTRTQARENAFLILFEKEWGENLDDIISLAEEHRDLKLNSFARQLVENTIANIEKIDSAFEKHLKKGWKKSRLSKTALAVLRLATYEILFEDDIPISVSINEAVELTKKYGTDEESGLINGILGSLSKEVEVK
jgi:N utilization substance protein B